MTSTCSGCYAMTFDLPSLNKSVPNPLHEGFPGRRGTISQVGFFQHEGKSVLAEFLVRDGHPDPSDLAERWACSLNICQPERRAFYTRELEPIATLFLDIFAHHLKVQPILRELNDSRVFEQLSSDLQAIRHKLDAEKATSGTRRDY